MEQVAPSLNLQPVLEGALVHLNRVLGEDDESGAGFNRDSINEMNQKQISHLIDTHISKCLLDNVDSLRDKARLNLVALPHAGDWLNVVPTPSLGLQMKTIEFRTAVLYRLGMPVFQKEGPCIACGQNSRLSHFAKSFQTNFIGS